MSITWKDVGQTVGKVAPLIGTLLGGPGGAAMGALVASALGTGAEPSEVQQALLTNPDAAIRLKEIESKRQVELQGLVVDMQKAELAASTQNASDINKTMQVEATAEHWATWFWRPFIGLVFGVNLLISSLITAGCYIGAMTGSKEAIQALVTLPNMIGALGAVNAAALPILGIASWFRGKMQADPNIPTTNKG